MKRRKLYKCCIPRCGRNASVHGRCKRHYQLAWLAGQFGNCKAASERRVRNAKSPYKVPDRVRPMRRCAFCKTSFLLRGAAIYCDDHRHIPFVRRVLNNIIRRCTVPGTVGYPGYGGKGIRAHISLNELLTLWDRDRASLLVHPSIDRKNSKGHYTFKNCRWIEKELNRELGVQGILANSNGWIARRYRDKLAVSQTPNPQPEFHESKVA